jgi:hypothetical protein
MGHVFCLSTLRARVERITKKPVTSVTGCNCLAFVLWDLQGPCTCTIRVAILFIHRLRAQLTEACNKFSKAD